MRFVDLHLHSHFSDGTYGPEELAAEAERCGLAAIALTDHDSVEGCPATAQACAAASIEFITGAELTAEQDGDELHVFTQPDYHMSERVEVTGRVAVTGSYPVRSGATRLSQLLANAGGVLADADSASVLLLRARSISGPDPEFERLYPESPGA